MTSRHKYLIRSAFKRLLGRDLTCPSCKSGDSSVVDRKYLVTALVRCRSCGLLYRTPTTTDAENESYYQSDYQLGFTTEMPSPAALAELKDKQFAGSAKDFSMHIGILRKLGISNGARILDFGCSWGYGSWQMSQAGFDVEAFEISKPRCAYARDQLGVRTTAEMREIGSGYDVFFSSHVMEHVPHPAETIKFAFEHLKSGGLFVAFTPNGSLQWRAVDRKGWHLAWGLNHPNMLDEVFYTKCFAGRDSLFLTTPCEENPLREFARGGNSVALPLTGSELLAVARNR